MTFDLGFKALVLAALFLAWNGRPVQNDNNRYIYQVRSNGAQDILLDTRTGRLFYLNILRNDYDANHTPVSLEEDPLTGERVAHWDWSK